MTTTTLPKQEPEMKKLLESLYDAFNHFNSELFNNLLPPCSISIGVKRGAAGVFYVDRFVPKEIDKAMAEDAPKLDDIMLNPTTFDRDETYVLSVLVHEMVHQWESEYGTPGKNGYHNRYWAESMKSVGLYPSSTGEAGGKETGRKVSHYILENGLFANSAKLFMEKTGFKIDWFLLETPNKAKTPRKVTYRCDCPTPMYASLPGRKIQCLECGQELIEDQL